jgi:hypothetical protein
VRLDAGDGVLEEGAQLLLLGGGGGAMGLEVVLDAGSKR